MAVTDEGLEAAGQHCRQLRVLRLYANSGITDVGVKAIANLPHLKVFPFADLPDFMVLTECLMQVVPAATPSLTCMSYAA